MFGQVDEIRRSLLEQLDTAQPSLKTPPLKEWFALATERIERLQTFGEKLKQPIVALSEERSEAARTQLTVAAIVTVILYAGGLVLASVIVFDLNFSVKSIRDWIHQMVQSRNLALKNPNKREDELGEIGKTISEFSKEMARVLAQVQTLSGTLNTQACDVADSSVKTEGLIDRQQMESQTLSAAIEEMAASINEVSRNTHHTAEQTAKATNVSGSGRQQVEETKQSIQVLADRLGDSQQVILKLHDDSKRIGTIIDTINGIAEQTNLLALNAAIEAARAGEQGRGFAVVADEVRSLAQRTQDATTEIRDMIESLQGASETVHGSMTESIQLSENCVRLSDSSLQVIDQLDGLVDDINQSNIQNSAATEEQSQVASEISANTLHISELATDTVELSHANTRSSDALKKVAAELDAVVARYQLK
ncbi:Predicted methyl-accepting chemotaxis protein [gamma proteobacterium HdN1]|nr:Predicted methyl-accepting chemotaxis protein [gamma proteobacterium HdN1]